MRQKMDDTDLGKKTQTNAFGDFLSREITTGQASKFSPPPPLPPPPPTPQTMRRRTQTDITSASFTDSPEIPIPSTAIKGFKYEPPKQVDDDKEDGDDYVEDDSFIEDETRAYGIENVGPVANPYLMPYV